MPYRVLLTHDAEKDLEELDAWIATHDSSEAVDHVLDRISEVLQKLSALAERGKYLEELSVLCTREIIEVFFKPYRIIYRVERCTVYVYLIADGRRDMQTQLSRRLLTD